MHRWTSLYARDRDSKNRLVYNEFAYKRPNITINLRIGSRKKAIFQLHIHEIADKKTACNEGRLYLKKLKKTLLSTYSVATNICLSG